MSYFVQFMDSSSKNTDYASCYVLKLIRIFRYTCIKILVPLALYYSKIPKEILKIIYCNMS